MREAPSAGASSYAPSLTSQGTPCPPPMSPLMFKHESEHLHCKLAARLVAAPESIVLDGYALNIQSLVAGARNFRSVSIDTDSRVKERIDQSVEFLKSKLATSIYGVTTGYGGSADTRSTNALALQMSLLEHQLSGILTSDLAQALPEDAVRGAMMVRVNSLVRGHSALRYVVLETMVRCLDLNITPVIPLRGTISASGDLAPLSYVAGAITCHPDVKVTVRHNGKREMTEASEAFRQAGITPIALGPKEGLALVNGTSVSASLASLVLYDSHFLAILSQVVTAMTVEALVGQVGSFHPFIHDVVRPHPGQVEVARNIRTIVRDSKLAVEKEEEVAVEKDAGILRQDRYPLRTSAQWLGPILTDLVNSHEAIEIELNSTTDNPLVDVEGQWIHNGGNFQAMVLTNAMEKTRLGLQHIGKLSFAQLTELINGSMNCGLPSCLAAEDPSTNYHAKGLDIAAAAYTSELGYLANPVGPHVQSAEQQNQAVNSLALISARKTAEANEVLSMLLASHLYCVCHALDLRYFEVASREKIESHLRDSLARHFSSYLPTAALDELFMSLKITLHRRMEQTTSKDLEPRWADAAATCASTIVSALVASDCASSGNPLVSITTWQSDFASFAVSAQRSIRDDFFASETSPTTALLGRGTRKIYSFVRDVVGVKTRRGDVFLGKPQETIGSNVSKIFEAIRGGAINGVLVDALIAN